MYFSITFDIAILQEHNLYIKSYKYMSRESPIVKFHYKLNGSAALLNTEIYNIYTLPIICVQYGCLLPFTKKQTLCFPYLY